MPTLYLIAGPNGAGKKDPGQRFVNFLAYSFPIAPSELSF